MPQWVINIALVILGLISISFLGLFLASGGASGEAHDEVLIEFTASAAEVMEWLVEPEKLTQWIGGLDAVRVESPDQFGVGTKLFYDSDTYGNMELLVEAWEPNRLLTLAYETAEVSGITSMELSEQDGLTILRYQSNNRFKPFIIRLMMPLFIGAARAQLAEDLKTLQQLIENKHLILIKH